MFAIVGTAAETLGGAIVAFIGAVAVIAVMVRRTR